MPDQEGRGSAAVTWPSEATWLSTWTGGSSTRPAVNLPSGAVLGCKLVQGYQIARPMAVEGIPDWLEDWEANHRDQVDHLSSALLGRLP